MKTQISVHLLLGLALSASGCGQAQVRASVCDLVRAPQKYEGSILQVEGKITGGTDGLLLSDKSCPGKFVSVLIDNETRATNSKVASLWSAVYQHGVVGTVDKDITASLVGTFGYSSDEHPSGSIFVKDVDELELRFGN